MSCAGADGSTSSRGGSTVLRGCTVFSPFVDGGFSFRMLELSDYDKNFLGLLGQLTSVGAVSRDMFEAQLNLRRESNSVWTVVVEEEVSGQLVACGSIFIELKFTHGCGMVGHIEDIVVSSVARGGGVGRKIVTTLSNLAQSAGCYKVVLDCNDANVGFYEKVSPLPPPPLLSCPSLNPAQIGFARKENQMALYFQ